MTRLLYSLLIHALLPWALLYLLWRARRQPAYLRHWGERFGHFPRRTAAPTLWLHAVSVGETRAAQPLVTALRARYPAHRILLTHMTPTGRATAAALFGENVESVYLPYDTPWAMNAFLEHFRPDIGLLLETELWPNLTALCQRKNIPLLLVNARLSARSARRYQRFQRLATPALQGLAAISAISTGDAERLRQLGAAQVAVSGNLKFDCAPPAEQLALGARFRQMLGTRPVFLCASTREGEEDLLLRAWADKLGAGDTALADPAPLLILVPRHPQRFDEVARQVTALGLRSRRRTDALPVEADTQVWLGDSMGELFAYYSAADLAFIGGSLLDFGSQNLIEPCAVGTPVLLGPSTFNFAEAARDALASGAARQLPDATAIVDGAWRLLDDPASRQAMGRAGRDFAATHRGATQRTLALIEPFIPAGR